MKFFYLALLVLSFLLQVLPTTTVTCRSSPFGGATRFNAVFLGDFYAVSSDVEGSLAVSGNVNITSYTIGLKLSCTTPALENAIAGGSFSWGGGDLKTGTLVYGTTVNVPQTVGWGCQSGVQVPRAQKDYTSFFNGLKNDLQSTSTYLKSLTATGVSQKIYSTLYFNLTSANVNVINTDCATMASVSTYWMVGSNTGTVIVNVLGTGSCQLVNGGWQPNGWNFNNTIWNFPEATSLTLASVSGTVLAPFADINLGADNSWGAVNGHVFGKNWRGSVQINYYPFNGCIPETSSTSATTSSSTTTGTSGTTSNACAFMGTIPSTCSCTPVGSRCACHCDCC
eukprot:TRINITY_DN3773_c0_g1_i3.p1 TRINITY_DN3773_c0_g1~~TRINITY_DN3773_c0_g1_i3.p1  ORF type:complete len:339 (-),score=40.84 TRINITY_DN3773_c0_g1_i3:78-1094(-)